MKRINRSPFQALKQEPVPVVPLPGGRWVYFISTGAIDANTSPISLQEKKRKQAMLTALIMGASDKLAKELGVSTTEARKLMSGVGGDRAKHWERLPEAKQLHYLSVLKAMREDQILTETELKDLSNFERAEVVYDPLDYLDQEQKQAYFELASESEEIPGIVATLMMKYRLAYDLTITDSVKAKSTQLYVHEPWFVIEVGDIFKFGSFSVSITSPYDPDSGSVQVAPIASGLEAGTIGFLLKKDGSYAMGDPYWTEEDTKGLSISRSDDSLSDVEAIYRFYRREAGEIIDLEEELEGKQSASQSKQKSLTSTSNQNRSTGTESTGKSNPMESRTIDSTPKILETSPTG